MLRPSRALSGGRPACDGDHLDVPRDDLRLVLVGNPWTSRRLDVNRHETGLETRHRR